MNLVPDWAPNIHPLVVHFPIALLFTAAAVDAVGWVLRCNRPLRRLATILYVLGAATIVAAYVTGRGASQTVWLPGMAQEVVKEHWDWAFRTAWFFAIMIVVRLAVLWMLRRDPRPAVIAALVVAGFLGVVLIGETAERGGRLVFQHGVGTARD